jgi:predicted O-linked N-acetylglucosamine transferase (SPINDLY family)
MGMLDGAVSSARQALKLRPDWHDALNSLGNALVDAGDSEAGISFFRRAIEVQPDSASAVSNLLFALNYEPELSAEGIYEAYREYEARFGEPHRGSWREHGNVRDAGRRLKIGYVSPDFRRHSARHFLEPVLARHDRERFEIHAYAELAVEDDVSARYRSYVDHWIATRGLSDDEMAQRIREDGIDVLVDLAGHTGNNRLRVFARKPAPVSVSWLGYGYTTGLKAIDYLMTDGTSAPEGSEHLFAEAPWRLATPGYAYRPAEGMGEPGELPARKKGYLTYGTLTRAIRINQRSIRVWSEILKRDREAHLVIDSGNFREVAQQERLAQKFVAQGIERERLEIGYHSPPWDVLRGIDIGLDCFPHNSGTTLFESLYLGVPYVTLAGRPSVGRIGSSVLEGVGHGEWIAGSEEEYVEKAVGLGRDWEALGRIRANLRGEMEGSALMDEVGFTRRLETAYRQMFERWARR